MHKLVIWTLIPLTLLSVSLSAFSAGPKQELCHNGKTIAVPQPAVSAHLYHGDTLGPCGETAPKFDGPAAVVIMRCKLAAENVMEVVSVSASFDYASIQPVEPTECAVALSFLLDSGFYLRSVTTGNAEEDGSLHLYTDYLLMGTVPATDS